MSDELKGIIRSTKMPITVLIVITLILIIFTIMCDMNAPQRSIIWAYNIMYCYVMYFIVILFSIEVWQYTLASLQFGANRRTLFYAIETMGLFVSMLSLLLCIGMNEFGKLIYGILGMEAWEMSIIAYIVLWMENMLLLKVVQYPLYKKNQDEEKNSRRKIILYFIGLIYFNNITLVIIKSSALFFTVTINPILKTSLLLILTIVSGVMIVYFYRKNYQLFMQREV